MIVTYIKHNILSAQEKPEASQIPHNPLDVSTFVNCLGSWPHPSYVHRAFVPSPAVYGLLLWHAGHDGLLVRQERLGREPWVDSWIIQKNQKWPGIFDKAWQRQLPLKNGQRQLPNLTRLRFINNSSPVSKTCDYTTVFFFFFVLWAIPADL